MKPEKWRFKNFWPGWPRQRGESSPATGNATAVLARSITRAGSKQAFYTARFLADKSLVDDCCRAYAYLRWADDVVDESEQSDDERTSFVKRQHDLIDSLYASQRPEYLVAEEEILADLVKHDRENDSGLQSFIRGIFAIIEFDAKRKGRLISQQELDWYSDCLAKAVTDGLQYFIGNGHVYPRGDSQYLAATGAHVAHLLRDTVEDTANGFFNIPREYLEAHGIGPDEVNSAAYQAWVRGRVQQAREHFRTGKRYLNTLDVLRCKLAGHLYCARFESVLDTIERDSYVLRADYREQRNRATRLKIARTAISLTLQHVTRRR